MRETILLAECGVADDTEVVINPGESDEEEDDDLVLWLENMLEEPSSPISRPSCVRNWPRGCGPQAELKVKKCRAKRRRKAKAQKAMRYAAFYLDGEANVWWQWLSRIYRRWQQVITWADFERELLTRFGTSDYHNYNEALARIRQTGNLREYIKEFERLA
ncbi:Unknown protein, partial [Striga hermonthica]